LIVGEEYLFRENFPNKGLEGPYYPKLGGFFKLNGQRVLTQDFGNKLLKLWGKLLIFNLLQQKRNNWW